MNLRQLQYFVAVAQEGGFRQGAARLRVAQPALSRQIQGIESELGLQLFDRASRRVALTPAGDAFLRGAVSVLESIARGVRDARLTSAGQLGRCVIAAPIPVLSTGALTRVAEHIAAAHPAIALTIVEADLPEQWRMLREGQADLVIGLQPPPELDGLASEALWHDPVRCVLVREGHRLAARTSVRLDELRDEPFLTLGPAVGAELWANVQHALQDAGISPARVRVVASMNGLRTLVAAGKGWALVSAHYLEHPPTGTAAIEVEGVAVDMERAAVWRADDDRAVLHLVLDVLRNVLGDRGATRSRDEVRETQAADPDPLDLPRALELRHLEYLAAAMDAASIGSAAEQLGIAQPVLSRQLRDLERVIGVELLERGSRGVQPTPAGAILGRDARRVLDELDAARRSAQRAQRAAEGQCVLATISTPLGTQVVASVLGDCARSAPEIDIEILEVPSIKQTEALLAATVDVGFSVALAGAVDASIEREHMLDDPIDCVLLARDHPLARHDRVRIPELASLPFLFSPREAHPAFHDQVMERLRRLDLASPVDLTYNSLHLRWSRAAEGKGWCLGFRSQRHRAPRGTVALGVDGLYVPWGMELLWRRDDGRPMVAQLVTAFRRAAELERRSALV